MVQGVARVMVNLDPWPVTVSLDCWREPLAASPSLEDF